MNRRQTIQLETDQHLEGSEYPDQCDGIDCWFCNPETVEHYRELNAWLVLNGNPTRPIPLFVVPEPPPPEPYEDNEPLMVELRRFWT